MMPKLQSKYMESVEATLLHRATRWWNIVSTSRRNILGSVRWYGPWRQYCFFPEPGTLFNNGCLLAIEQFLSDANMEHKEKSKPTVTTEAI